MKNREIRFEIKIKELINKDNMIMKIKDLDVRKKKFAQFLVQEFPENYDITFIEFPNFGNFKHSEDAKLLNYPGIYGIHCFATDRTLITYSNYVAQRMCFDYFDLENDILESPKPLQKDFNKYDLECFIFIVFCLNPEWDSIEKLEKQCDFIQSLWPYSLYKFEK